MGILTLVWELLLRKEKKYQFFTWKRVTCFDQRVPEELNRKIADHLSDINITISKQAKEYLISEG